MSREEGTGSRDYEVGSMKQGAGRKGQGAGCIKKGE